MRTQKEIEDKINELYEMLKQDKIDVVRCIVVTDALSWVLGDDYLDNAETND